MPSQVTLGDAVGAYHAVAAGDFLVWRDRNSLKAAALDRIFFDAVARSAPPPSIPPGSRLVVNNVPSTPIAGGNFLFWLGQGAANPVYSYSLDDQKIKVLNEDSEQKLAIAADERDVVWVESLINQTYRIMHYDLATSQLSVVVQTTSQKGDYGIRLPTAYYPILAVSDGVLYYQDTDPSHKGLWSRVLATGEEHLINTNGYSPRAVGRYALWLENRVVGNNQGVEYFLHLYSLDNPADDTVIATQLYGSPPADTAISQDKVAWIINDELHIYNIASKTSKTIFSVPDLRAVIITQPVLGGGTLAWDEEDLGGGSVVWSIKVYDPPSGKGITLVSGQPGQVIELVAVVGGRYIAYQMDGNLYLHETP